jgi:nicotinamidase-related amidase
MQSHHQTIQPNASQLVVVDIQTRLSRVMPANSMQQVVRHTQILLQAAALLEQPIIVTEQYPQGLGQTLPELLPYLPAQPAIEKVSFSACGEPKFTQRLIRDKAQIVLVGMEAHICILQTAMDLLAMGKQVFVVEDAIISRSPQHLANAIDRMRAAGCLITNTESAIFEPMQSAQHPSFKAISTLIR